MKNSPWNAVSLVYNPKTMSHQTIWKVLVQMFQWNISVRAVLLTPSKKKQIFSPRKRAFYVVFSGLFRANFGRFPSISAHSDAHQINPLNLSFHLMCMTCVATSSAGWKLAFKIGNFEVQFLPFPGKKIQIFFRQKLF